jgi:hypothetical protein
MRNESPKQSEKYLNNKQIVDINSSKVNEQKKLESFEINMLQNQRKKEYETFKKQQDDKIYSLKKDWKKLDEILNQIDSELEENKKKKKKL